MCVAGGGSFPSGALAQGRRAEAAVRLVLAGRRMRSNQSRNMVIQLRAVFRVDAAVMARLTPTAGPMNVTVMCDAEMSNVVDGMLYDGNLPGMMHLGDQLSFKGVTVGRGFIGIAGDATSRSTRVKSTEVMTRQAPANPAVESGICVVATWGAAPAIVPMRIRGKGMTVVWGLIPSPCIVAGRGAGGPGGPRPRFNVLLTSGADLGSAATASRSGPACLAMVAHTGRVRAVTREYFVGMRRRLGWQRAHG